jgi:SMC interacting uncharacterized protein involved in chromosome segregation
MKKREASPPSDSAHADRERRFDQTIAKTVDTLVYQATQYIGLVQNRSLKHETYQEEIIAETLRLVARELYRRQVTVTFPKRPSQQKTDRPLRFVVTCERGKGRLEVYPVKLEH